MRPSTLRWCRQTRQLHSRQCSPRMGVVDADSAILVEGIHTAIRVLGGRRLPREALRELLALGVARCCTRCASASRRLLACGERLPEQAAGVGGHFSVKSSRAWRGRSHETAPGEFWPPPREDGGRVGCSRLRGACSGARASSKKGQRTCLEHAFFSHAWHTPRRSETARMDAPMTVRVVRVIPSWMMLLPSCAVGCDARSVGWRGVDSVAAPRVAT